MGIPHRLILALATTAVAIGAISVGSTAMVIAAGPPADCNTPFNGGLGVLETPQNTSGGTPFLTKTLTNTSVGSGSTTYFFTLATTRSSSHDTGSGGSVTYTANTLTDTSKTWTTNQWANATVQAGTTTMATVASNTSNTLTLAANWSTTPASGTAYTISFFSELLDCAWDVTQGGSAATANYASQQNVPSFTSGGQLGISLTVNKTDAICDRVQLKGTTPGGTPFVDYSNLVGSPNGTSCTLPTNTPEVQTPLLFGVAGGAAITSFIVYMRRRRQTGTAGAPTR